MVFYLTDYKKLTNSNSMMNRVYTGAGIVAVILAVTAVLVFTLI